MYELSLCHLIFRQYLSIPCNHPEVLLAFQQGVSSALLSHEYVAMRFPIASLHNGVQALRALHCVQRIL